VQRGISSTLGTNDRQLQTRRRVPTEVVWCLRLPAYQQPTGMPSLLFDESPREQRPRQPNLVSSYLRVAVLHGPSSSAGRPPVERRVSMLEGGSTCLGRHQKQAKVTSTGTLIRHCMRRLEVQMESETMCATLCQNRRPTKELKREQDTVGVGSGPGQTGWRAPPKSRSPSPPSLEHDGPWRAFAARG